VYSIAMVVICVGWPGFLVWAALKKREDRMRELEVDEPDYLCKPEYLVRKVSLIEAEQENSISDPLGLTPNLPFGHLNAAWGKFLLGWHPRLARGRAARPTHLGRRGSSWL
jgi:hypothetical protein